MKNHKSTPSSSGNISEAIEDIRRMFVDETQIKRIVTQNQTPAKRAAFAKTHGIVNGILQINDDIDTEYRIGIFQPAKSYTVWVRYSSDTAQTDPDFETTVGMGIKVFNVSGKKVLEEEPDGKTVDFILQNTPVFFAADAIEMSDFKAAVMSGNLEAFRKTHPASAEILDSMEKEVPSLLTEKYWSCIPYKFGDEYCKYIIEYQAASDPGTTINIRNNDYLAQDLSERLMNGNATLNFYIQKRNNPETQSIISARSLWDEKEAKPVKIATLTLYQQNIQTRKQFAYGESLAFNIFRTLPEMEPVGSIAEARKVVYQSSAMVRRNVNGESIGEPVQPRSIRFLHYYLNNDGSTGGNTGGSNGGDTGGNTGGSNGGDTGGNTGGNTGSNMENHLISPNGFPEYYTIKDRRSRFWSQYQYLPFYINKNDTLTIFVDGETEDNLFASIGLPSDDIDIYPLYAGNNSLSIESSGILSFINHNEDGEIYIKIHSQHQRVPYFKLYESTSNKFKNEMLIYKQAPYALLSNSLSDIIISYSSANLYIDDAEKLMEDYEFFIAVENNINGLVANGKSDYKLDNNRNLHIEVDFYYIHANNEYTGYNIGAIPQLLGQSNNRFDVWYINGVQRQQYPWQWSSGTGLIEATANIYLLSVQEALTGRASMIDEYREKIENFIADTSLNKSFDVQDVFVKSALFWQLHLTFGEQFYPQLNQKYRLMDDTLLTEDDDWKKQTFILTVSQLVNINLLPFFFRWGLELDLNTIFELSLLPGLVEPIWENNNDNYHQLDMPEPQYIPELIHLKNAISNVVIERKSIEFTIDKEWHSPYRYVFFINDYYLGEINEGVFYYCYSESADEEFYVSITPGIIDEILDDDIFKIIIDFQGEHISYYSSIRINKLQEDIENIFIDNDSTILEDKTTHSTLDELWDRYNEYRNEYTIHLKNRLRRAEYILLLNTINEFYIENNDIVILFSGDDSFINYQYMLYSNEGYLSEITYGTSSYSTLNDRVWITDSTLNSTTAQAFYIKAFSRDEEYILNIISIE